MSALTTTLESRITDALKLYQATGGTDAVKETVTDLFNLDETAGYTLANHALARMMQAHIDIRNARDAGDLYAWVSPRFAAVAFEGVFEACVGVWLANGVPADPTTLRPSVERFVRSQVRMFAAIIGDH